MMMISCKRAAELTCQSLDRELTLRERIAHRMHLLVCRGCYGFLVQTRKLDAMFEEHFSSARPEGPDSPAGWLPEDVCRRLQQRLQQRLREEESGGGV